MARILPWLVALAALTRCRGVATPAFPEGPLVRAVDLNLGEAAEVELWSGEKTRVKLLALEETPYGTTAVVREARVTVEVNGERADLISALYRLPRTVAGVQIDCPITRGYVKTSKTNAWALDKDARLRLWPAGSPWMAPGAFGYPVRQRWFATDTQMGNEPCYVNELERFTGRIYYHYGLDIGGQEGKVEVLSASDGVVIAAAKESLPGHEDALGKPRRDFVRDTVYVRDAHGWYFRYSHLHTIDVKPGQVVKKREKLGLLGKEGDSGGWSHLHFDVTCLQPSGRFGILDGYAFLWESYHREHHPGIVAVARPHGATWVGEKVLLDATRSWSSSGKIARAEWTFTDGTTATGSTVERSYDRPGAYSEILKVVDTEGRVGYDFAVIHVLPRENPKRPIPAIHATYFPTFGIRPGDPVTFQVRTFETTDGSESWDFGDGSPRVEVKSDGNVNAWAKDGYASAAHPFERPGDYVVRVERTAKDGLKAVAHLHVRVE